MLFKRKEEKNKVCPRCGLSSPQNVAICPDCGLIFARMDVATNKDAKRKIRRRDKDFIIKTANLPSDVKFLNLFAMALFTGIFGGHCFYVGRYWRGSILLVNFLLLIVYVIFNSFFISLNGGLTLEILAGIGGLVMLIWPIDIVLICMKMFKVPVAIDVDGDEIENKENTEEKE